MVEYSRCGCDVWAFVFTVWTHDGGTAASELVNEVDEIDYFRGTQVAYTIEHDGGDWGAWEVCGKESAKAIDLRRCQLLFLGNPTIQLTARLQLHKEPRAFPSTQGPKGIIFNCDRRPVFPFLDAKSCRVDGGCYTC